ncbi:MAG: CheR family methyltransferase [Gemmatimonadaceae bacterium]
MTSSPSTSPSPANADLDFEALLVFLKSTRGFDFTGYKRTSLMRRVAKRMQAVNVTGFADYLAYLQEHEGEYEQLFNVILINVTAFFRDPEAWQALSTEIIPRLLDAKGPASPIRVWSAGCASGEEAYTLAMVLYEALGADTYRDRVKVYATDVDEQALMQARHGVYTAKQVEGMPANMLEKYFDRTDSRYVFRTDVRRGVIFGRHDLIQDAPISRIDLITCRNALMYFSADTQGKILSRFHFALNDTGYLFLGRAETLLTRTDLFSPVDLKRRIFQKVPRVGLRERLALLAGRSSGDDVPHLFDHARLRHAVFDVAPLAQLVIDPAGMLSMANGRARALFGLGARDIGRPLQDLELSYRPVELRSCIDRAYAERRAIEVPSVLWTGPLGEPRAFDVEVMVLSEGGSSPLGVSVTYRDVTEPLRLREQLEHSNQELEAAYEELQSTNEELETTNEELQSTVEELETTNEELQSTNEELETMNEELQSTNEELQTINDEARRRSEELNEVNAFLESVLGSLSGGVVVLDREMRVMVWNAHAEELWGLRADEVADQHFLNLDIGLPAEQLKPPIRSVLSGEADIQTLTIPATNRRGKAIECRVTVSPLAGAGRETRGVIFVMEALPLD